SAGHDRLMWREAPTGYFENLILDSPNVKGIKGLKALTHFRLKHLGYISKELVDKKADIYKDLIAEEKKASLQEMYLTNERKIKWNDQRNSRQVILLNTLLNLLLAKQLAFKVFHKGKHFLRSQFIKTPSRATVSN
ncbi:MAG: hypothetical protein WKF70_11015, partial [Chitinophagaceae bacterium]